MIAVHQEHKINEAVWLLKAPTTCVYVCCTKPLGTPQRRNLWLLLYFNLLICSNHHLSKLIHEPIFQAIALIGQTTDHYHSALSLYIVSDNTVIQWKIQECRSDKELPAAYQPVVCYYPVNRSIAKRKKVQFWLCLIENKPGGDDFWTSGYRFSLNLSAKKPR